jgi:hypothetical protein
MEPANDPEALAQSTSLGIYRCSPDCFHVRVGPVTLDLTAAQFWELVTCFGEASVRLLVRDAVDRFTLGPPEAQRGGS